MEDVKINGNTEQRPVMQIVTNRGPLNRAIFKATEAIGLSSVESVTVVDDAAGDAPEAGAASAV